MESNLKNEVYETLSIMPEMVTVEETAPMWDLKSMQDFVGGLIERIPLYNGDDLVINEEGLYLDLPINVKATEIFFTSIGNGNRNEGVEWARKKRITPIVGDVLLFKGGMRDA